MKQAKYAGLFYEAAPTILENQIRDCFLGEKGPGALPTSQKQPLQAIITPHAGYVYSGQCAAWSYKALAESEFPDLFIMIGPSHNHASSGFSMDPLETPLGIVRVDQDFARRLSEKGNLKQNEMIHDDEHCLEVQIPFLQFIFKNQIEKIRILPILISHDADIKKIALDIKETIIETNKKVKFIISSDFTHYGSNYHHVPFSLDVKKNIYELDGKAIDFIKSLDSDGFLEFVQKNFATICGALPISLLLKTIKSDKIELEQYYTSGDLTNDYKNSVSYASILFR